MAAIALLLAAAFTLFEIRLRVAPVLRDYGKDIRDEAPRDSRQVHG